MLNFEVFLAIVFVLEHRF